MHLDRGINQLKGQSSEVEPGRHAGLARNKKCRGASAGWHDRIGREIAGSPEIFKQRHANQWLDHDMGER
jgi:hypothetical protein